MIYPYDVVGNVYSSSDYDLFRKMEFNRIVDKRRKQDLIESFSEKDIMNPIICTPTKDGYMLIAEGQGRYEARKDLGLPIVFIVVENLTIDDCMQLNKYNKAWTSKTFIDSYAAQGDEDYNRLKALHERTRVPVTTITSLLIGSCSQATKALKTRSFRFSEDDEKWCEAVIEVAKKIFTLCEIDGKITQTFYRAVALMMTHPDFDEKIMIKQCKKVTKGKVFRSIPDNLTWLSNVYNKDKKRALIHFEDMMGSCSGSLVRDYSKTKRHEETDVSTLKKEAAPTA